MADDETGEPAAAFNGSDVPLVMRDLEDFSQASRDVFAWYGYALFQASKAEELIADVVFMSRLAANISAGEIIKDMVDFPDQLDKLPLGKLLRQLVDEGGSPELAARLETLNADRIHIVHHFWKDVDPAFRTGKLETDAGRAELIDELKTVSRRIREETDQLASRHQLATHITAVVTAVSREMVEAMMRPLLTTETDDPRLKRLQPQIRAEGEEGLRRRLEQFRTQAEIEEIAKRFPNIGRNPYWSGRDH